MNCSRCGHDKEQHQRDAVNCIRHRALCDCDKFGVIQCVDCGKWVGRYIASNRCEHHSAIYWREQTYTPESQERNRQLQWLQSGRKTMAAIKESLKDGDLSRLQHQA